MALSLTWCWPLKYRSFNFDETKFIYFYFVSCTFGVISRSHCLKPRSQIYYFIFFWEFYSFSSIWICDFFRVNFFVYGLRRHLAEVFCKWNSIVPASVIDKTFFFFLHQMDVALNSESSNFVLFLHGVLVFCLVDYSGSLAFLSKF